LKKMMSAPSKDKRHRSKNILPMKNSDSGKKLSRVMMFAGEASGDLQAAMLARELKRHFPGVSLSGVGGTRMKEEGFDLIFDSTVFGVIGPWEGIRILPTLISLYEKSKNALTSTHPDLAVLIDTPAFNMRLARLARKLNIPTVYYFPPSAWSGSTKRAREIADSVTSVIAAFQFTADTYRKGDIPHFYTGHPLVDVMQKWKEMPRGEILSGLGLQEGPAYVALMPGSRTQEINHVLSLLLDAAKALHGELPGLHFLMPIASPLLKEPISQAVQGLPIPVTLFQGRAQEVMAVSRLSIMASGSASLEASLLEVPMILTYRLNSLDYRLIRFFVKLRWAGLPNLIMQREIVPELIQEKATVENICTYAKDLIRDGEKRQKMISDLKSLNSLLGEPGVIARIARHVMESVI